MAIKAEKSFNGCISQAPAVSRKIDQIFGSRPGRIFVVPSGDEAGLPTHAGGAYSNRTEVVSLARSRGSPTQLAMWFKGPPVSIRVEFDDDFRTVTARTDSSSKNGVGNGINLNIYTPGQEFYPATSASGDHFVNVELTGHAKTGRIILQGFTAESGRFDMYSDPAAVTKFMNHLVPGRLTDYASTKSAIVIGAYVSANKWVDINGKPQEIQTEVPGQLWSSPTGGSAGGPTRDGRRALDVAAPGETIFATYAKNSYWATFQSALIQDGGGHYGRQGATSGAAPIGVGAIALMLQMKPDLTAAQARALLTYTATSDADTGSTPNNDWGYGKINVRAALDRLCALYRPPKCRN
jgi:hypothetical protein